MGAPEVVEALRRAGLRPPKVLTVAITSGCNLRCDHCMVESPPDGPPVPGPTLRRLLREFGELGGQGVCLTGGEPLLHPEWLGLVEMSCRDLGFPVVRIQTNAVALTETDVRSLAGLGCPGIAVQVSLEGARAATHDRVRGAGSFDRAVRGLRHLVEGGLASRTSIAFTEMRHNVRELPDLFELADRLGVGRVTSASLVRHGRARASGDLLPPEPAQYRELVNRYHSDNRFRALCESFGSLPALEWVKGADGRREGPCTFVENPYVTADGRLYPCVLLHEDRFAAAGAHERPLAAVLRGAITCWARLQELSRRRLTELEECRGCPGRLPCAGGCMGRACSAHGDPFSVEDRCGLRRAVYKEKVLTARSPDRS